MPAQLFSLATLKPAPSTSPLVTLESSPITAVTISKTHLTRRRWFISSSTRVTAWPISRWHSGSPLPPLTPWPMSWRWTSKLSSRSRRRSRLFSGVECVLFCPMQDDTVESGCPVPWAGIGLCLFSHRKWLSCHLISLIIQDTNTSDKTLCRKTDLCIFIRSLFVYITPTPVLVTWLWWS